MALLVAPSSFRQADAACYGCITGDATGTDNVLKGYHIANTATILGNTTLQFLIHKEWLVNIFFKQQILPALMKFTEQMSAVGMQQVFIFGTFLDAKHQLETQQLLQELEFQAHKDYQPSDDFCWFGTNVRSMAASEQLGRANAAALASRQLKRQLGNANTAGAEDADLDKANRWAQFLKNYCDPNDNNRILGAGGAGTGLESACGNAKRARSNNDIDFTRVIDEARTLNVAFDDDVVTSDEEDIIAMASNLYGHNVLSRRGDNTYLKTKQNQPLYFALRSVAAKRSVAENSFDAIIGLKSAGTDATSGASRTRDFLGAIMQELGVPAGEIYSMIGEQPSYYAQLEILAKKIYQNPDFFAGLYDSPANVERKSVALKAIELMLDRAIYESQVRQEMATSVLLTTRMNPQIGKINRVLEGGQ